MPLARLILLAVIAVLTMSAVPVLVKSTLANPVTIGIARLGIAALAFAPIAFWRDRPGALNRAQWLQLMLIGAVFGIHWLTYFTSIKYATAAVAALAISTYGVQYMLLAWLFNGERVTPLEWLGIAWCFGGCVIVSPELSLDNEVTLGIFIGLGSALLYAALPLLHQRASGIPTLTRTWGQFFFGLLVFLPLYGQSHWELPAVDLYKLLVLGLVCTVVSHGLWVKASTELPALFTSMIHYLYVPLAALSSVIFLGEEMTPRKLLGLSLVISASVGLSIYRFKRLGSPTEQPGRDS